MARRLWIQMNPGNVRRGEKSERDMLVLKKRRFILCAFERKFQEQMKFQD